MKTLLTAFFLVLGSVCMAQNAGDFFTSAGNQFIDGNTETALKTVNRGLDRFPGDDKLQKLKEELEKQQEQEQEQKEQQQQQEEQQKQDQEKKDQQQKDQQEQEKKDQQEQEEEQKDQEQKQEKDEGKENEEKKDEEKKDSKPTEEEKEQKEKDDLQKFLDKLKEMKISPEKAQMILEAMKNNEVQYVQQNKRKATKRKDRSKPDW